MFRSVTHQQGAYLVLSAVLMAVLIGIGGGSCLDGHPDGDIERLPFCLSRQSDLLGGAGFHLSPWPAGIRRASSAAEVPVGILVIRSRYRRPRPGPAPHLGRQIPLAV